MKISVITPSYNSGDTIEKAIKSVLAQDYTNYEHIIVDGGSSDNTLDILKEYDHLKWVSEPDNGQVDALNKGFSMSTGDVIVYLNADDFFLEKAFSKVIPYLQSGEKLVVGKVLVRTERADGIHEWTNDPQTDFASMLRHWVPNSFCVNPLGYFYLRELQEKIGGFNEDNDARHDLEFLLELSLLCSAKKINEVLGVFNHAFDTKTGRTQLKPSSWSLDSRPFINRLATNLPSEELGKFQLDRERGYQLRRQWAIKDCFSRGMVHELIDEGEVLFLPQAGEELSLRDMVIDHLYPAAQGDWIIPVLTIGNVASKAICQSLKALPHEVLPAKVYHLHMINENSCDQFLPPQGMNHHGHALVGMALKKLFDSKGKNFCWKFIAGVREPVGGCLSEFFEVDSSGSLEGLEKTLEHMLQCRLNYFDEQYLKPLGVNVYDYSFDQDIGYSILKEDNVELLLYRFEDLPRIFNTAIEEYLGIANVDLVRVNIGSEKSYAHAYKQAVEKIRIERSLLDKIYSSEFMCHFYSDEEIDKFYKRWQKK